jgi:hypothetical protein
MATCAPTSWTVVAVAAVDVEAAAQHVIPTSAQCDLLLEPATISIPSKPSLEQSPACGLPLTHADPENPECSDNCHSCVTENVLLPWLLLCPAAPNMRDQLRENGTGGWNQKEVTRRKGRLGTHRLHTLLRVAANVPR